jgi:hypothetical protein
MQGTLGYIALFAAIILAVWAVFTWQANNATGSVFVGSEYNTVHLTAADIGTTTIKTLPGSIGSIVVSSSTNSGGIIIHNTTGVATSSGNTLFSFNAGADEGTYQYDVTFTSGLLIDVQPGFNGNMVLTWR